MLMMLENLISAQLNQNKDTLSFHSCKYCDTFLFFHCPPTQGANTIIIIIIPKTSASVCNFKTNNILYFCIIFQLYGKYMTESFKNVESSWHVVAVVVVEVAVKLMRKSQFSAIPNKS